jgi:hypothetical protein
MVVNRTLSMDGRMSDEELIRQVAAGRAHALAPLHSRYASLIFAVAARCLDRSAADEISQEVFLVVWRDRGRPRDDLAVLSLSRLAPAPPGCEHRAWACHAGRWTLLGRAQVDAEGRSLIIAQGALLAIPPDQLLVTLDPVADRAAAAPGGQPVVRWPAL